MAGQTFDIIIIDGYDRMECARRFASLLAPHGAIIFDDTEHHTPSMKYFREQQFQRVDF